ncbi:MAG: hypothetical protein M0R80_02385 [Proteobacteria bacterium]|jgi:hypothetical protein|nr:hypothetical protein [Pseudomonadota bacterium]
MKNTFKCWIESKDIFGFERELYADPKPEKLEKPVKEFSLTRLMTSLGQYPLGVKEPNIRFINEIQWGQDPGAIRVRIGNKLCVMVERLNIDLQGMKRWGCKRFYQIPQDGSGGQEESVSQEIMEVIKQVDMEPLDSANHDYKDLEELAASMSNMLKKTSNSLFIFEGTRKNDEDEYIIRFSVRGMGQGWRQQRRIEENHTRLNYNKDHGVIKLSNFNIYSPQKGREWQQSQQDLELYFFPSQPMEEVVECISNWMYWY